ncbi:aldo/keto reductase [Microbacterium sp. NPDC057407]|uniref:aldo/keto reductase n=1 Tax=Microbacterium sp. NPDC057407 TaxID=3346120 RepID=UPI0036720142
MHTRRTGRAPATTEIGLGAAQLGNLYREVDDDAATATVDAAWDAGIRYFDTAPHYGLGLSETRLGAALSTRPRDDYVLSTKVGRLLVEDPGGRAMADDDGFAVTTTLRRRWDFSRDGILRSVESSLQRLQTDRLDIAYLHDPDEHWDAASTTGIEALVELRDQGVITAIGAGMNQSAMLTEFVRRCDVDITMVAGRYTLLDQSAADDLLPIAADRGVAVVAAAIYNSGLLSADRPREGARYDYSDAPADLVARAHAIADVCERHGTTLPAAAIAYPLRSSVVTSVVIGMRGPGQVASTLERYGAAPPDALWADLEARHLLER